MSDEAVSLARWRLESAKARLAEARNLLRTRGYPGAINRAYYAIFTAVRALLALKRIDSKTHQAAFLLFQKHYVKTGLFPRELAELAKRAKGIREADRGCLIGGRGALDGRASRSRRQRARECGAAGLWRSRPYTRTRLHRVRGANRPAV